MKPAILFLKINGGLIQIRVFFELLVYLVIQVNASVKSINLYKSLKRK